MYIDVGLESLFLHLFGKTGNDHYPLKSNKEQTFAYALRNAVNIRTIAIIRFHHYMKFNILTLHREIIVIL
jgi:hypothetical protein